MKKLLLALCFGLLVFPVVGNAGNMFGPAAFRNGSPLVTGVDGTYQATARAENVTGIFRFAYSGGSQTAAVEQNTWIFFVNGQIQKGSVVANINETNLNGILDTSSASSSTNTNSSITLPYVVLNQNNSSSGTFSGKINLKSPNGSFSGSGDLSPLPAQTNQITAVSQNSLTSLTWNGTGDPPAAFTPGAMIITNASFVVPAGSISPVNFKFRGVRTSTSSTGTSSTNSSTN